MEKELARHQREKSAVTGGEGTPDPSWQPLVDRADAVVQAAMAELPDDVLAEAQTVPVLYEEHSERDGEGRQILGIYRHFEHGRVARSKGPIVLYLRTIENFAGNLADAFERQVRATYLHELGHHLGWGEGALEARGL